MQISEIMTAGVRVASPDDTIENAARSMGEIDAGVLPVGENDRLVGMITDRDIAIRGIGQGRGPDSLVRDIMSSDVRYCFQDEDVEQVSRNMGDLQVRRLPVLDRNKRLVGIVSLGDLAVENQNSAGQALQDISERGGQHSQSGH